MVPGGRQAAALSIFDTQMLVDTLQAEDAKLRWLASCSCCEGNEDTITRRRRHTTHRELADGTSGPECNDHSTWLLTLRSRITEMQSEEEIGGGGNKLTQISVGGR